MLILTIPSQKQSTLTCILHDPRTIYRQFDRRSFEVQALYMSMVMQIELARAQPWTSKGMVLSAHFSHLKPSPISKKSRVSPHIHVEGMKYAQEVFSFLHMQKLINNVW